MNRSHLILLLTAIAISFAGCSKEGDTGPAGRDGNANVYTRSFVITPADWVVSSAGGGTLGEIHCELTDTNLTAGILDSGSVEVFQKVSYWESLPVTEVGTNTWGNHLTMTTAHISLNTVNVHRFRNDDSLPPVPNYNTTYKVVITAGHH